ISPEDRTLADRVPFNQIVLPEDAKFEARFDKDLLDGVVVIHGDAVVDNSDWGGQLYRLVGKQRKPFKIKAIPYYARNNHGRSDMRVWIRIDN
ncbi:unnamed protein product, partial [marine sediment metagenome]